MGINWVTWWSSAGDRCHSQLPSAWQLGEDGWETGLKWVLLYLQVVLELFCVISPAE